MKMAVVVAFGLWLVIYVWAKEIRRRRRRRRVMRRGIVSEIVANPSASGYNV